MLAAGTADFQLDEGLDAEADAIDAGFDPRARLLRSDCAGGRFERGFDPGTCGNQVEDGTESAGGHAAGGAPAEINSLRLPIPGVGGDLLSESVQVTRLQLARKDARGEIAVCTL